MIKEYLTVIAIAFISFFFLVFSVHSPYTEKENQQEVEQVSIAPEPIEKPVDQKQLQCLAENIYHEARGESDEGKAAVAWVVMNRVRHGFAPTPCKVVYKTTTVDKVIDEDSGQTEKVKLCQFSWVCDGVAAPSQSDPLYKSALYIAYNVLSVDAYKDVIPSSAVFFHNASVSPQWKYYQLKRIGNHIFYGKSKPKKPKTETI